MIPISATNPSSTQTPKSEASKVQETSKPFLSELCAKEPSLPIDFFTSEEIQLIQNIFSSYQLSHRLCLIDLLGFDFYVHLTAATKDIAAMDSKNEKLAPATENLIESFCGHLLGLYKRLFRNLSTVFPMNEFTEMYSFSENGFVNEINKSCESINFGLKIAFEKGSSQGSPTVQKQRKELVIKHYRSGLEHFKHLSDLRNLLTKILQSTHKDILLFRYDVGNFPGNRALFQYKEISLSQPLSEFPGYKDAKTYLQFLSSCLVGGKKTKISGFGFDYFDEQLELLSEHKKMSTHFLDAWERNYRKVAKDFTERRMHMNLEIDAAIKGHFTHTHWLKKYNAPCLKPKGQKEFTEFLIGQFCQTLTVESWAQDLDTLFGLQLFLPSFPKAYVFKEDFHNYYNKCVTYLLKNLLETKIDPTDPLSWMEKRLLGAFSPLANFITHREFYTQFITIGTTDKPLYANFLTFIHVFKNEFPLIEQTLQNLKLAQEDIVQQFLEKITLEEIQKDKLPRIQNLCTSYFILSFVAFNLFNDAKTIIESSSFLRVNHSIPEVLKNLLSLPLRLKQSLEKHEDFLKKNALESVHKILPVEEKDPPPLLTLKEVEEQSKDEELIQRLKQATKRREFEELLPEFDFVFLRYGKGSHSIWKNSQGDLVVLPHHNSLKPGTRHDIVKQILNSLE